MCTIQPDLAAYLLNYQGESSNEVGKCSSVNNKSSFNTIAKEISRIESGRFSKRRNRKSACYEKSTTSMVEPIANKKRQNNSTKPKPKKQRVSQVSTCQNNSTNDFLSNESVLKLLNYEEPYAINTSFTPNKSIENDTSRYVEKENLGFYSDVSESGMLDSDSDEGSDDECFTDDQLALIETVMSHDNTIEENQREISSRDRYQHDVDASVITSNTSFDSTLPQNTDDFSQNSTNILAERPESCTFGNEIQNVNHERPGEEMLPDENEVLETSINTPSNEEEIVDTTLQPVSCQQENLMVPLDVTAKNVPENTEEFKSNSDTDAEIRSMSSRDEEYCCSGDFSKQQSELVESAKKSKNVDSSSEIVQGSNNIKCLSQEIEHQDTSLPSGAELSDQGRDPVLDSDCEIRSIQSEDSDVFSRKEVIASTPIQSAPATSTINNTLFDTTSGFDIHQHQQKVMSKQVVDYLMQMDEDNVDDAIDNMLSRGQLPKFIGLSPILSPHKLPIPRCNEDMDKLNINSDQEEAFEDMILEPDVCEVTVDNGITDPLEDVPFLPPKRKPTDTATQEKCYSTNPNSTTKNPNLTTKNPSLTTKNPKASQSSIKKTCKPKASKIQVNIPSKPQKDRTSTQSKPKGKKCALMTEVKKQQLLAKYIPGKQMQLFIPFLPINSKKKKKFKVLPSNTTLFNKKIIDKPSSEQEISKNTKDNGDIDPSSHFITGVASHTQQNTNAEKQPSEDLTLTDNEFDKAKPTDASIERETNSIAIAQKVQNWHANGIASNSKSPFPTSGDNSQQLLPIGDENHCRVEGGKIGFLNDDISIDSSGVEDHHAVSMETSGALQDVGSTVAKATTNETNQVENASSQTLPMIIDKSFDNGLSEDASLEVAELTSKERHHSEKCVTSMKHSEDNNCTQTNGDSAAGNCCHAHVGCSSGDTLQQEKELNQGQSIELSLKQITSTEAVSSGVYSSKGLSIQEEDLVKEKSADVTIRDDMEESMQSLTEGDQSDQSNVFLNCNLFMATSQNTRPEQSSAKGNTEPRKSFDSEDTTSCDFAGNCRDILHQEESKGKKEEEKLLQNNSMDLSCSYLDLSSHENSTSVRKRTLRKRKSKKFKDYNVSPECKSEGDIELKKPRQKLKEKVIKYYKEKIKKLKKENEQYKDKSLVIDLVSNFKNEITQLKKSIEMLQKKTEEQEAIINRQESYLQRLGHEISSGDLQSQTSRSFTSQPFVEDRQDATITSSDHNECSS